MKLKRLNNKGFSHDILLVVFVVLFAIIGVGFLVAGHAAAGAPYLGINSADCTNGLSGWAESDGNTGGGHTMIIVYADGPAGNPANTGSGTFVGETNNHGNGGPAVNPDWSMAIPASLAGSSHSFYIYAIGENGNGSWSGPGITGSGNVYGNDPITSTACSGSGPSGQAFVPGSNSPAAAPAVLGVNSANCTDGLSGWAAADLSGTNTVPITIYVYADGPAGNLGNPGSGTFVNWTTNHGLTYPSHNPNWSMAIPASLSGSAHKFYIYAVDTFYDTEYSTTGPGVVGSGAVYGNDPITSTPCASGTSSAKAPISTSGTASPGAGGVAAGNPTSGQVPTSTTSTSSSGTAYPGAGGVAAGNPTSGPLPKPAHQNLFQKAAHAVGHVFKKLFGWI